MAKNDTNIYGMNVQGSDATPEQFGHFFRDAFAGSVTGMAVAQNGTPNMSVTVARGTALLTKNTFTSVIAEVKADTTVAISTANTSNPRIDAIIAYEDTSYTWTSGTYIVDGLQRFKLASVVGTAAASPAAPSDATIQSEIGAGKPWTRLANVTVPTNTTTIINSNISDQRSLLAPKAASVGTTQLADSSVSNAKLSTATGELGAAWQSWTPTWTNLTVGNGTVDAKYIKIGKTVHCSIRFTMGSTSVMGADPNFTLPITAASRFSGTSARHNLGGLYIEDLGVAGYVGDITNESNTGARPRIAMTNGTFLAGAPIVASQPMTWGVGDFMAGVFTYEAA